MWWAFGCKLVLFDHISPKPVSAQHHRQSPLRRLKRYQPGTQSSEQNCQVHVCSSLYDPTLIELGLTDSIDVTLCLIVITGCVCDDWRLRQHISSRLQSLRTNRIHLIRSSLLAEKIPSKSGTSIPRGKGSSTSSVIQHVCRERYTLTFEH